MQAREGLKSDEDDWTIRNSPALSALMNIASWVRSGMVSVSLKDLIELEHETPSISKDLDTLLWQALLVKGQTESELDG